MEVTNAEKVTELIEDLKKNPAYAHIDIDIEIGKLDAWLLVNPRRKKSQRFIVAWLNRIEKPSIAEGLPSYLKKLSDFYNRKLTPEQVKMWDERFSKDSVEDLLNAAALVTDEEKFFPTPNILAKCVSRVKDERLKRAPLRLVPAAKCPKCGGDGCFVAQLGSGPMITFRCDECRAWEGKYGALMPLWSRTYVDQGYVLYGNGSVNEKGKEFLRKNSPASYGKLFGEMPKAVEKFKDQDDVESRKRKLKEDYKKSLGQNYED